MSVKYYLIAGEASGDLHASHLITSLRREDPQAEFRFFGGDKMAAASEGCGTLVKHYRDLAYMGFIPVLRHLPTIMRNMRLCREDILSWQPDCVIFVDYAGFNLRIAKYLRRHSNLKLYYYISPKIWAWKEWRIKDFKRDIDEMFCILPFEKDFFERKHHYPVHYVGNPTMSEVRTFEEKAVMVNDDFLRHNTLSEDKPIIAVLPGSRRQEIKANLPTMLEATRDMEDVFQVVIPAAPGIEYEYYKQFTKGYGVRVLYDGWTYQLLYNAKAALVTSGTATLETCCFGVPQVVCYHTSPARLTRWAFDHILSCKYISLVNLIADDEVVPELFADRFSAENIRKHLSAILYNHKARQTMLWGYKEVHRRLGNDNAPANTAAIIHKLLNPTKNN